MVSASLWSLPPNGTSLNDVLLQGPDLTNSLLGVLLRFRREPIAIMADIQHMFYCFLVKEEHRNFLKFLWYKDNDPQQELVDYRMKVHVFGNSPSPAVATYGLRRAVDLGGNTYDMDVQNFVGRDFYVDDGLTSLPTVDEAIELMRKAQHAMLSGGNLRLHKITSNSAEVMATFPSDDLAKDLKDLDFSSDALPLQRSLGIACDLDSDTFTFRVSRDEKPFTKRGILSTINSIYDPMGFAGPVTIHGKILFRDLMSENAGWDQPLPHDQELEWELWRDSLKLLENWRISRTYFATSFQETTEKEVIVFSDASEKAIAAVAYLRSTNGDENQHTGFILGKTKVAPSHGHTIPRLELCAAVLAVEIAAVVCQHLDLPTESVRYFSDSKVVLGYIHNNTRRFYVYVTNRVQLIRKYSSPEQWNYVPTDKNPADSGTRSVSAAALQSSSWIIGPRFTNRKGVDDQTFSLADADKDKELRPVVSLKTKVDEVGTSLDSHYFEKFSSWESLIRVFTVLRAFAHKRGSAHGQSSDLHPLTATEYFLIRMMQQKYFGSEMECLQTEQPLPKGSPILNLDPALDDNGLLRVGGRLNKTDLEAHVKNPIIVPGNCHIAKLLVCHYHDKVKHQGRHFTEGAIRAGGLWIMGVKRLVSSQIYKCVACRKLRGRQEHQKMADLPVDRLTPSPPFTYVGVDMFGPWTIVTRRSRGGQVNNKRWAVLFTCLVTRAVHIEVTEELSSSSFINALRRFVAIRGDVNEFRSDRGTNFVGACDLLNMNAINVEDTQVQSFLSKSRTEWMFNPPHASHMGGV